LKPGPARLLFPALRWDAKSGFDKLGPAIEDSLRHGVGGFIVFGGAPAEAVLQLTDRTQSRCDYALIFGSDLERGAGQQFVGAAQMPPLAALGYIDDTAVTTRAAEITAREARALGINWAFAPDCDLDAEPRNPIVGTRSFGDSAHSVARHVDAWVRGCHAGGAMACAKHFPGHGRTIEDSHATLPRVTAARALLETDLEPFRAAVAANVDAVMTAHVVFDAFDPDLPATLSEPVIAGLLRRELRFEGLVVTDGLGMQGILDACDGSEQAAGIAALNAGCDALLYPTDERALIDALNAEHGRALSRRRITEAIERVRSMAERATGATGEWGTAQDRDWAFGTALRAVHALRDPANLARSIDVLTIDDDLGGPFAPPPREFFIEGLRANGFDAGQVESVDAERPLLIAVYADIRAWKGRPGISAPAKKRIEEAVRIRSDAVVVLFSHPRLAEDVRAQHIVCAWGGEPLMQQAAARWLAESSGRQ
jgi:beta-glucosidase-like glycosyl hydrolase